MQRVRVLVVDDSPFIQRAVIRMLGAGDIEVVGVANDGLEAVDLARDLAPDVILLDINMPHMDGLAALERIMNESPTAVLLMSTLTASDADITMRGLELGAVDFIDKSKSGGSMDFHALAPTVRSKVLNAAAAALAPGREPERPDVEPVAVGESGIPQDARVAAAGCEFGVVVIGASTGGPRALTHVLPALSASFPAPVVVAQHMPPGFTATLASRLDRACALTVREARDGDLLRAGVVLIGPGGRRGWLEQTPDGSTRVRVAKQADSDLALPSVDELFASASEVLGACAIGVVLTGMGQDGARGLRLLRDAGAPTVVESEDTAVIYGMPREARPSAVHVARLERIGPMLSALCRSRVQPVRDE